MAVDYSNPPPMTDDERLDATQSALQTMHEALWNTLPGYATSPEAAHVGRWLHALAMDAEARARIAAEP